jgi:hypothetical protein
VAVGSKAAACRLVLLPHELAAAAAAVVLAVTAGVLEVQLIVGHSEKEELRRLRLVSLGSLGVCAVGGLLNFLAGVCPASVQDWPFSFDLCMLYDSSGYGVRWACQYFTWLLVLAGALEAVMLIS